MIGEDEPSRDLAALAVPQAGQLIATGDRYEPYRLVGADGAVVAAATAYFRDLLAAGRAEATVRSYGMDLLRWFRFLWSDTGVAWDRATRIEARDFCRWLQVAGKQSRPHWRVQAEDESAPARPVRRTRRRCARTPRRCCGPSTTSTWMRAAGRSSTRSRSIGLVAAGGRTRTTIPWSRTATSAADCIGPGCRPDPAQRAGQRVQRDLRRLPSHRDRALVAFYVSTGARASELLSATLAGVDPGRQVITVVRKGSRELQELPASHRRIRLAAALPGGDGRADPQGPPSATVVGIAPPGTAAHLSRGAPHVRAGERPGGHGGDVAFAAAYRGLPDGRRPGPAAHRRSARTRPCPAHDNSDLPDPAQGGRDPPGTGPSRPADPAGGRRGRALPRRPATGPRRWTSCSATTHRDRGADRTGCVATGTSPGS